jgi:hypothetical protein
MTASWIKLHNEELHDLYPSPCIIRIMKWRKMGWAGHVAQIWKERNACRLLVEKPEGKRPLGRRWIILRWILERQDWGGVDWIGLSQHRDRAVVNAVMKLQVP